MGNQKWCRKVNQRERGEGERRSNSNLLFELPQILVKLGLCGSRELLDTEPLAHNPTRHGSTNPRPLSKQFTASTSMRNTKLE